MPPRVAPVQVVIVPILYNKDKDKDSKAAKEELIDQAYECAKALTDAGVRVEVDDRLDKNPGWKYSEWELKGVPLRLELGPDDVKAKVMQGKRRTGKGKKEIIKWAELAATVPGILKEIQAGMLEAAREDVRAKTARVKTWKEFVTALENKMMVLAPWCGSSYCEEDIKARSGEAAEEEMERMHAKAKAEGGIVEDGEKLTGAAKSLCVPFDQPHLEEGTTCVGCGKKAINWTLFGRSY